MVNLTPSARNGLPNVTAEMVVGLSQRHDESTPLTDLRLKSLAEYLALELPTRDRHLWRYTDPVSLLPGDGSVHRSEPEPADVYLNHTSPSGIPEPVVQVVPGAPPLLNDVARESGIEIVSLQSMTEVTTMLGTAVSGKHGLFEAYNGALWDSGLAVRIPENHQMINPLRVVVWANGGNHVPRLLVIAETNSSATVVEDHIGGNNETRVIGVTELLIRPGANLHYVLLQDWSDDVTGHLAARGNVEREGHLTTVLGSLGGERVKMDLGARLVGPGATSDLYGIVLGENRQQFDHHTVHEHHAPHTRSNLEFKAALAGKARSSYTGLIRIDEQAPACEAYQENRNLLLSDKARTDTIPELEILTDDVSCSHGATASPIDPEQIFYLQSRGIDPAVARNLIVWGFFAETLKRIPDNVRPGIETLVAERLLRATGGSA